MPSTIPVFFTISATSFKWGTVTTNIEDGCQSFTCFKGHYADMFIALQSILNFTFTIKENPPQNILGKNNGMIWKCCIITSFNLEVFHILECFTITTSGFRNG